MAVPGETLVKPRVRYGAGGFLIFVFSDCELDLDRFELRRAGRVRDRPVPATPVTHGSSYGLHEDFTELSFRWFALEASRQGAAQPKVLGYA